MGSVENEGRVHRSVSVTKETDDKLRALAGSAGMNVSRLTGEILDEVVPKVRAVRRRMQLTMDRGES